MHTWVDLSQLSLVQQRQVRAEEWLLAEVEARGSRKGNPATLGLVESADWSQACDRVWDFMAGLQVGLEELRIERSLS